jgi:hypothetical protein
MGYSRWMLSDLQVHTPFDRSHGYGDVGGPDPNPEFADELIRRHHEAGVRIVAVTDHNTVDWWPVLAEAGGRHGVFVFPGLEVNVNKCHLLAIWERDEHGLELARQFLASRFTPGSPPLKPDRTPNPVQKGNVLEVAAAAVEHQGLVLAPHATQKKMGLFASNVCNVSGEVAQSGLVAGFDITNHKSADVLKNPRSEFGDVHPSWFSSGDVRSMDDVGARACFLKVSDEPSLESLRQAFLMPATRIRLRAEMEADWGSTKHVAFIEGPAPKSARIDSIAIRGGFHDGLEVALGPGLNAVIGGKGTGKSTLIEVMRFVLDQPPGESGDASRRANFPNNADATLEFTAADGEHYTIEKAGSSESASLLRDGEKLDFDVSRRVDVQLFGQRELAKLPSDPAQLRRFVLTRKAARVRELEIEVEQASVEARSLAEQIDELDAEVEKHADWDEELKDVSDRLKRLTTSKAQKQIKESQDLVAHDAAMDELMQWPEAVIESIEELLEVAEPPPLPEGASLPTGLAGARKDRGAAIRKAAKTALREAKKLAGEFESAGESWDKSLEKKREEVASLLASAGLNKATELTKLQGEKTQLEKNLSGSAEKLAKRKELIPKRTAAISALDDARRKISRLTEEAVGELNEETGPRVRLVHEGLADRTALFDFISDRIVERKITAAQSTRLEGIDGRRLAAAALEGGEELDKLGLTATLKNALESCEKSVLRELEEVEMLDELQVQVDISEGDDRSWTDVTEASPGQAATALLELALIAGDEPLVIDQPEDDLDNRFIYEEVVKRIAEVSTRRQLIVVTHNANIPVLGDAELILALEATSAKSRVLANGGLDEAEVASTARRILEGGEEAFAARAQRYSTSR